MPVPILTVPQMRAWEEATWRSGKTHAAVIENVGRALAQRALQLTRDNDFILIVAGKGHNGDDARAALGHLRGRSAKVIEIKSADDVADLNEALDQRPALIVDGLFGIGLNRPLDDAWKSVIARINAARRPVLAVDVPSGLNADTGEPASPDGVAIEAALTLTVGAPKAGLLANGTDKFVGRLEVADDVGLCPCAETAELQWTLPRDFADFPQIRPTDSHKGKFGHLAIIAGSVGYHGAAVLATRGAQRAQPGLVTVFTQDAAYPVVAAQLQSAMVKPWDGNVKFATDFSAVLIGPGLAAADLPSDMKLVARKIWRDSLSPVIVDASALDWLPLDPVPRGAIRVITPHPGEAARLLKATPQQVQQNRPRALRDVSKSFGNAWVVLKGHHTLIGHSSGEMFVNSSGNPYLAQGGSGDLLGGFIAGLLAQPALQSDVATTLRFAVWQHSAAADALQMRRRNWIVEDLANELGNVSA